MTRLERIGDDVRAVTRCAYPRSVAKPIRIAGVTRRMPAARAAAKILEPILDDLVRRIPDARRGDPEKGIHDLRVAVKRFREAFRLFRPVFRKKTFRKHRTWIEQLNDALGEVRDRDVALERLAKLTSLLGDHAPPSVKRLRERLESERLGAVDSLAATLDRVTVAAHHEKLAAKIGQFVDAPAAGSPRAREFALESVRARLATVRARWVAARREATPESLHRVRIGNKRLRYAIEPFALLLPKEVRRVYRSATRFHDALGDLHDADSMAVMLETAMAGAPKAERRTWERLSTKVIAARRVALRKAFALADRLEPEWEAAERSLE